MITKITSAKVLRALEDGEYHVDNIGTMQFSIKEGVVITQNGKVKTFEQFSKFMDGFSIVGPHLEWKLTPEEEKRIEANHKHCEVLRAKRKKEHEEWNRQRQARRSQEEARQKKREKQVKREK